MDMKKKGLLLVLATAIISGVSIFLNAFAVKGFDSSVFTFSKNILVAALLSAGILAAGMMSSLRSLTKKQWSLLATIGLIGGSVPFLLFFKGMQMATGPTSAFIHKSMFIVVAILAAVFLKEHVSKWFMIGAAVVLAGTFLMVRPDLSFSVGHLLIAAATLLWAIENTISKHAVKDIPGTVVAWGRMAFGSIFILAFLVATGKAGQVVSMSSQQYLWILVTSALLLGFVWTFYNGIKSVPISTATAILSVGAPTTVVLTWVFGGVALPASQLAGTVLIVVGVVLIVLLSDTRVAVAMHGRA
ncbi:MAG: DMT family transporter [Nanoarchaeota archaeon]